LQIVLIAETSQRNLTQESFLVSFDDHLRHVGGEPSRSDGIHLDVVNSPLARQILGECDHAAFACVVADGLKFWRRAAEPGNRSDINYFSAPLRDHDLADCLRKEERPG